MDNYATDEPEIQLASAGKSFVDAIKDNLTYSNFLLQFQYEADGSFIIPRTENGLVLTAEDFTELCAELQRFYSATTSEQIKEENERVKKSWQADRPASQPAMPKKSREGFVYLLRGEGSLYKIGKARDVNKRVLEISPKMPFDPILLHTIKCDDYTAAEAGIHSQFNHLRVNGEWFRLGTDDVSMIQSIACYRDGEWGWL